MTAGNSSWWRGAVIYQIYPRSFMDANGDGVGDLPGITSRLDHVAELGADAVWISPFFTSPMRDFGYDVSNYRDVDPMFGTLADFQSLLDRAHELGLKVLIDQVLSHTSDEHPWFQESRKSGQSDKSDWYVWADAADDGGPPNNWLAVFGGSAWTWDEGRRQYYLHNFLVSQPDLNFHNPEVCRAQLDNVKFWLDLGVDGFRFDVVNFFFHNQNLRSNPPVENDSSTNPSAADANPYFRQQHIYDIDQPENLTFLADLRKLMDRYPDTTSVGEISSDDSLGRMAEYTGGCDKLHMAYTFDLLSPRKDAGYIRSVVSELEARIDDGWPCWALSNHDVQRAASRLCPDVSADRFPRASLAMLLSLRGSPCIYQGEELGLRESEIAREDIQDPFGIEFWPEIAGRDGCRTPIAWSAGSNGGFSTGKPWLPVDDAHVALAVESQENSDDSTLSAVKRLIQWRKKQPALLSGSFEMLPTDGEMLCWLRRAETQTMLVAINLTGNTLTEKLAFPTAEPLNGHGFSGYVDDGDIVLKPYDAFFASINEAG